MTSCEKCGEKYSLFEISHDIPKYIGGMDCDGRHNLCVSCHNKYERTILARCFILFFHQLIPFFEERGYSKYMILLKNSPYARQCQEIAKEVKFEWFEKKEVVI